MRKSTLLDSLFLENEESIEKEIFDQSKIEREIKYFYQKLYKRYLTYANSLVRKNSRNIMIKNMVHLKKK